MKKIIYSMLFVLFLFGCKEQIFTSIKPTESDCEKVYYDNGVFVKNGIEIDGDILNVYKCIVGKVNIQSFESIDKNTNASNDRSGCKLHCPPHDISSNMKTDSFIGSGSNGELYFITITYSYVYCSRCNGEWDHYVHNVQAQRIQ